MQTLGCDGLSLGPFSLSRVGSPLPGIDFARNLYHNFPEMSAYHLAPPVTVVGIDPGKSGGLAFYFAQGGFSLLPMPDTEADLVEALRGHGKPATAYLEKLPLGHPNANVSSMAKLHRNGGVAVGALTALGWRIIEVRPQEWQGHFSLGTRSAHGDRWKAHIKAEAQRRHPDVPGITLKTADALMILAYGLEQERV